MQKSDSIAMLATAFVAAQVKIKGAPKDKTNPHYNKPYADLESVMQACKEALNGEGIAVIQASEASDSGQLKLETILMHKSGEFISGTITMPLPKNDPQGYGSAMTYARRYGLAAMVGVCPEDDDGNAASGKPTPQRNNAPITAHEQLAITTQEAIDAAGKGPKWMAEVLKRAKAKKLSDLSDDQLNQLIATCAKKAA